MIGRNVRFMVGDEASYHDVVVLAEALLENCVQPTTLLLSPEAYRIIVQCDPDSLRMQQYRTAVLGRSDGAPRDGRPWVGMKQAPKRFRG